MLPAESRLREQLSLVEEENRQLKARIERMNGVDSESAARQAFGLTVTQARLFVVLVSRGESSRESLIEAVYPVSHAKMISVEWTVNTLVKHIRHKIAPYGIEIGSVYGFGYTMTEASRARARALMKAVQ